VPSASARGRGSLLGNSRRCLLLFLLVNIETKSRIDRGISLVINRHTGMTSAYEIMQWIRFAKEIGSLSEKPKMRSAV